MVPSLTSPRLQLNKTCATAHPNVDFCNRVKAVWCSRLDFARSNSVLSIQEGQGKVMISLLTNTTVRVLLQLHRSEVCASLYWTRLCVVSQLAGASGLVQFTRDGDRVASYRVVNIRADSKVSRIVALLCLNVLRRFRTTGAASCWLVYSACRQPGFQRIKVSHIPFFGVILIQSAHSASSGRSEPRASFPKPSQLSRACLLDAGRAVPCRLTLSTPICFAESSP
jgi:hypothetical protein